MIETIIKPLTLFNHHPEELALQFQAISLIESEQQAVIKQQNK